MHGTMNTGLADEVLVFSVACVCMKTCEHTSIRQLSIRQLSIRQQRKEQVW